jgi:alpha-D-ribose 1-methylphosphonate 5-triphosphate diphosphatase
MKTILTNAHIVTPDWDGEGSVVIEGEHIVDVCRGQSFSEGIDLDGAMLAPGCIDVHSDYLEKEIRPRPSAEFSLPLAMHFMDQRAVACGLTTVFSAISFSEDSEKSRAMDSAIDRARHFDSISNETLARHYVHARLDPNTDAVLSALEPMKEIDCLTMVVYNDSIPGQRQFPVEHVVQMRMKALGITELEARELVEQKIEERSAINHRGAIRDVFAGRMILGSHDDTTIDHVDEAVAFGATLCEMPTTIEAARHGKEKGMMVCMGAPNYVRGGSHCGNLACSDAMAEDLVHMICSDYHFPSMLGAVVKMLQNHITPSRAFDYVSRNPAEVIGFGNELGSIEPGKLADMIAFKPQADFAQVRNVWVGGTGVYSSQPRLQSERSVQREARAV